MALRLQQYADASPDVGWKRDGRNYVVLSGTVEIGNLVHTLGPAGREWWGWFVAVPRPKGGGHPRGTAPTLEDAKGRVAEAWRAWLADAGLAEAYGAPVDVVFDGPPGPSNPRLIEVEDSEGRSIKCGEWVQRPDGYWVLRIGHADLAASQRRAPG